MTQLKIKITKNILTKTMYCTGENTTTHCAVSEAVRDIFPLATTGYSFIRPFGKEADYFINIPFAMGAYIKLFDITPPDRRPHIKEAEFVIEVSDTILEKLINIDDIKKLLENHPTLQFI